MTTLIMHSWYLWVLIVIAVTAVVFAIISWVKIEKGHKVFWRQFSKSFFTAAFVPFVIWIFYFWIFKREPPLWILLYAPISLMYFYWDLIRVMCVRPMWLTLEPKLSKNASGLRVGHLSDLHICTDTTMEGNLPKKLVLNAAESSLKWVMEQNPDIVVLTGDITDSGKEDEWRLFTKLLNDLPVDQQHRVVVVPGNHDLTLPWLDKEYVSRDLDGNLLVDFEQRCAAFVNNVLVRPPETCVCISSGREVAMNDLLVTAADYRALYSKFPPSIDRNLLKTLRSQLWKINTLHSESSKIHAWRSPIGRYLPPVSLDPSLLTAAGQGAMDFWPTPVMPLIQDFVNLIYPLIVHEDKRYIVVALNSNTRTGFQIADGAIGILGDDQLERLEVILNSRPSKCAVILIHHHVGIPDGLDPLDRFWGAELAALQLKEASELCKRLANHHGTVVMHGHDHQGYWAKYKEKVTILSGASVAYGNKLGGDNCYVYNISPEGEVSKVVSERIAAA